MNARDYADRPPLVCGRIYSVYPAGNYQLDPDRPAVRLGPDTPVLLLDSTPDERGYVRVAWDGQDLYLSPSSLCRFVE